jgi:predicted NBD/HSP70 family sugar kinase
VGNRSTRGHELRAVALVRQLRRRGPSSRAALAEAMGTSPKTLRNTIDLLEAASVVGKYGDRMWLDPGLGIVVGVDVTHTTATVAISRFDFVLLNDPDQPKAQCETAIEDPETSLRQIAALIAENLHACVGAELVEEKLIGVGLTLPGPILRERNPKSSKKQAAGWNRRVQAGAILPGWDEVNVGARLATLLKEEHGLQPPRHEERRFVWVENDASAGALGVHTELRTNLAEEAPEDLLYVRMTSGIGAGIINKGHLVTGANGFAGELGHVSVDPGGALCPGCGGRGCLESLASNRAVAQQLRIAYPEEPGEPNDPPGKTPEGGPQIRRRFEQLLEDPHPAVDRALWDAGWHVGSLLAKVCCVLNPAWIVLGGAMPEHRSGDPSNADSSRPFVDAVEHAVERDATTQIQTELKTKTWLDVRSDEQPLSPELLGALALVVDHLGDAYLLDPIERWIGEPDSRERALSFS